MNAMRLCLYYSGNTTSKLRIYVYVLSFRIIQHVSNAIRLLSIDMCFTFTYTQCFYMKVPLLICNSIRRSIDIFEYSFMMSAQIADKSAKVVQNVLTSFMNCNTKGSTKYIPLIFTAEQNNTLGFENRRQNTFNVNGRLRRPRPGNNNRGRGRRHCQPMNLTNIFQSTNEIS